MTNIIPIKERDRIRKGFMTALRYVLEPPKRNVWIARIVLKNPSQRRFYIYKTPKKDLMRNKEFMEDSSKGRIKKIDIFKISNKLYKSSS